MLQTIQHIPLRRTKIIATLGPATDKDDELSNILAYGVDAVRLNFSHGTSEDHQRRAAQVRAVAAALGKEVAIIADLQGPKIRIAKFANGPVELQPGAEFVLDVNHPKHEGNEHVVGLDYADLPKDVSTKDFLLLDDGRLVLQVKDVQGSKIITEVVVGGQLSNNKGINRQGGGLSAKALTDKDKEDLKTAIAIGADYIAISFPRNAQDIEEAKSLIAAAGGHCGVIAKIERTEAVAVIDEIIKASACVMVARGDLGVEIGDARLPEVQKHIIQRARSLDKPVITATQMMESMITNAIPTRAEVFDVANAVLDGTDAVMLSAETASGHHPAKVVEAMARICIGSEAQLASKVSKHRIECMFTQLHEAIAMAAMYTANHFPIACIIALTESGSTPLLMSRIRSGIPIFGLTRHVETLRKMALYRGVYPINCAKEFERIVRDDTYSIDTLKKHGVVNSGDHIIITHGDYERKGQSGSTNTLRIITAP